MRGRLADMRVSVVSAPGETPLVLKVGKRIPALIGGIATAGFCVFAILFLRRTELGPMQGVEAWVWAAMPYVLAAMAAAALARMVPAALQSRDVEITDEAVHVRERGLLGRRSWTAPLADYAGVRWRRFRIHDGDGDTTRNRRPRNIHVIDLAHEDPDRCVPLRVEHTRGDGPRAEWEAFARQIGLPAIDARDGAMTVRAAEDVDKSVRDLAREGKIDGGWDDRAPPETIEVHHHGDEADPEAQEIRLTLHVPAVPRIFAYVMYGVAGVMLVSGLVGLDLKAILMAAIFGGVPWLINWIGAQRPPQLSLTRQAVAYTNRMNDKKSFTLPIEEIESVHLAREQAGHLLGRPIHLNAGEVVLSSDRGEKRIGGELPRDALTYLRDIVRSALANA